MNAVENLTVAKDVKPIKLSTTGKILIGLTGTLCSLCNFRNVIKITGGAAVALSVICAPFVSPALRKHCLPYIPATNEQVKNIFVALKNRSGSLIDLGSGDGRIVIGKIRFRLPKSTFTFLPFRRCAKRLRRCGRRAEPLARAVLALQRRQKPSAQCQIHTTGSVEIRLEKIR